MPTCNCPITKTLDVFYQVTDPPATANHEFRWRVVGDTTYTTISPNPTPILVSAPDNYKVQLPNIPVCQNVEVSVQRQCANNQNSIVQTVIAQPGLSYGCTQSVSGTHTGSGSHIYPTILLNLSTAPEIVTFNYSTVDPNNPSAANPPNRFLIKNSENITVFSSQWKGQANYIGEWGASLNTATTGSFYFNRGTGCFYTLVVDTFASGTQTDYWSLTINCSSDVVPPSEPTINYQSCSSGYGSYLIAAPASTNMKISLSVSGTLSNNSSTGSCARIDGTITSSTGPTASAFSSTIATTGAATFGETNALFVDVTIPSSGTLGLGNLVINSSVDVKNSSSESITSQIRIFEVNGIAKDITQSVCQTSSIATVACSATVQNYFATKYSCSACELASLEDGVIVAFPTDIIPVAGRYYVPSSGSGEVGTFVYRIGATSSTGPGLLMQNISATTCSGACTLSRPTTSTTPPPISNTIRLATIADVGVIPNASVGDLIVFGPNDGTGLFIKNTNTPIASLAPGAKILIRGGYSYDFIEINSNLAGTLANPIVITNFCGQVETESFGVVGMSHFKLTSKYDPANKTGDINYPGHAAGYAWSQGKYGIFINAKWLQVDTSLLYIISGIPIGSTTKSKTDNYEVEYIESGNGGYSNAFRWDQNDTFDILDNIRIHDNYFHDIRGEAIYMGIAASYKAGYEIFQNLKVYNNRVLRSGAEGIQIKRIGTGSEIYNNATVNTGLGCVDSQNFATVLWPVNGNTSVNNNLFVGNSGYSPVQWYIANDPQYFPSATTASFVRNAMLHLGVDDTAIEGRRGFFNKALDVVNPPPIPYREWPNVPPIAQEISSNYFGFFNNAIGEVVDNYYVAIPSSPVYMRNNTYTGKSAFLGGQGSVTINSNNVNGIVNDVSFVNFSYGVDFDWSRFRYWNNDAGLRNYTTGWYVTYKSKIYKAIANSNNIEPGVTAGWQTYWELKTYNGGTSFFPADDIRVSSGNFYNTNNIGLLDNPYTTPSGA